MSLVKDWYDDNNSYRIRTQIVYFFSPKVWFRLHKWRKQRADRGWSDRDTWGAGDHIAKVTADMLQHLHDHAYTDWPEWFKLNVKEEGKGAYKNLPDVINDITAYLDFTKTSWADDLECETDFLEDGKVLTNMRWTKDGRKLSERQIKSRIKKHCEQEQKLYKKAQKAMGFFARHFSSFWD